MEESKGSHNVLISEQIMDNKSNCKQSQPTVCAYSS